jgi:hypothetical protein
MILEMESLLTKDMYDFSNDKSWYSKHVGFFMTIYILDVAFNGHRIKLLLKI